MHFQNSWWFSDNLYMMNNYFGAITLYYLPCIIIIKIPLLFNQYPCSGSQCVLLYENGCNRHVLYFQFYRPSIIDPFTLTTGLAVFLLIVPTQNTTKIYLIKGILFNLSKFVLDIFFIYKTVYFFYFISH